MDALVVVLALAGDDAPADHLAHGGGEHLGVQTQVMLVHQVAGHGVRQRADAQLDGVAVVDQFADQTADGVLHLGGLHGRDLGQGLIHLIEAADVVGCRSPGRP